MIACWPPKREIVLTSSLVTPGATEIVTLADAKTHLRVDGTDEDALIQALIDTATEQARQFTGRTILYGNWKTEFDFFAGKIKLDVMPIKLASVVVKYKDSNNQEQALPSDNFFIRDPGPDAFATIEFKGSLPTVYDAPNSIWLEYNAGYEEIPPPIKTAVLIQVGTLYENRQSEIVGTVTVQIANGFRQILYPYKMMFA